MIERIATVGACDIAQVLPQLAYCRTGKDLNVYVAGLTYVHVSMCITGIMVPVNNDNERIG